MRRSVAGAALLFLFTIGAGGVRAAERDAVEIARNIRSVHMPHGTVMNPIFASADSASPDFWRITSYDHNSAGDSAIWTGHYLAGEAFRYRVTRSPEALDNVRQALAAIRTLREVTGRDLLARSAIPADSPWLADLTTEPARAGKVYTGTVNGRPYYWIGSTSRDQYSGIFFGLGLAYDLVDDVAEVRDAIREDVTRFLDDLLRNNWAVVMPDGKISTVFWGRPEQQLSFLAVGRRVNPTRFDSFYRAHRSAYASTIYPVIAAENQDADSINSSYYKYNLNYINLYNLIRLEDNLSYRLIYLASYNALRNATKAHQNAHFNLIDRALRGPNSTRDAETRALLDGWLLRPRRDYPVDLTNRYPACGDPPQACFPIPVAERPATDFLWQRTPFYLTGGYYGLLEPPGIDYQLPYWMGRFYGVVLAG